MTENRRNNKNEQASRTCYFYNVDLQVELKKTVFSDLLHIKMKISRKK